MDAVPVLHMPRTKRRMGFLRIRSSLSISLLLGIFAVQFRCVPFLDRERGAMADVETDDGYE